MTRTTLLAPVRRHALPILLVAALASASCVAPTSPTAPARPLVGFLAVGDTGYHLDYLDRDDYDPPLTLAGFLDQERADWVEDKLPAADFTPPPTSSLAGSGAVVAASGLHHVARAMRAYCESRRCDFGTMLGDNIYPDGATAGADGRDDAERFRKVFDEPFDPLGELSPDFRMYAALGNHDWRTSLAGALAQAEYHANNPPFHMDGFFYRVRPPGGGGLVELFVLDTEMLLAGVYVRETALEGDGRGVLLEDIDEAKPWTRQHAGSGPDLAAWLDQALTSSTARWKIVLGHHPLWSTAGSKFAQAEALRKLILPTLCRNADLYLAGHEHTLELHLDDCSSAVPGAALPPLLQVVSGAGAKQRPTHPAFSAWQQAANPQLRTLYAQGMVWGFAHLELHADRLEVRLVTTPNDGSGVPVEQFSSVHPRRTSDRQIAGQRP